MDGQYPGGTGRPLNVRTQAGFNRFPHTPRWRSFPAPPRVHRSFPLAELL